MQKRLPIGISDFKEIIEGGYAYADKTLLIQELIEQGDKVSLIPRMRRFGKTLNLSMLRYFFEKSDSDTSYLFQGLNIWKNEKYRAFVLGLLLGLRGRYEVKSNRESGYGRYDVMLIPAKSDDLGIVMEFKKIGRFEQTTLENAVASALKQIEDRHYDQELLDRGVSRILHLGLAFEGKRVLIRSR
jgi:hypothetical protein